MLLSSMNVLIMAFLVPETMVGNFFFFFFFTIYFTFQNLIFVMELLDLFNL
jgi:hypothetical protein